MKVLDQELKININGMSAVDFRDEVVEELEKLRKEPFGMSSFNYARQVGQQECLNDIIKYLKYIV